jgi:hypothetical protein
MLESGECRIPNQKHETKIVDFFAIKPQVKGLWHWGDCVAELSDQLRQCLVPARQCANINYEYSWTVMCLCINIFYIVEHGGV